MVRFAKRHWWEILVVAGMVCLLPGSLADDADYTSLG